MADPLLRLAGLKVQMGQTRILHGVDLDVAGGCLALVAVSYTHLTLPTIYSV